MSEQVLWRPAGDCRQVRAEVDPVTLGLVAGGADLGKDAATFVAIPRELDRRPGRSDDLIAVARG